MFRFDMLMMPQLAGHCLISISGLSSFFLKALILVMLQDRSNWSGSSGLGRTTFSQGKHKIPFYKKQVINKGARAIFGLLGMLYYNTENTKAVSRVRKLSAAHARDLFLNAHEVATILWKIKL